MLAEAEVKLAGLEGRKGVDPNTTFIARAQVRALREILDLFEQTQP